MVRIEYMRLSELKANPRNPKSHDVGAIQASVGRFGFRDAVILDERTGQILSGHGRVETLARMAADGSSPPGGVEVVDGQWSVPVQRGWASASDAEADAFVIAINRTTQLGGWDEEKLERLLVDLAAQSALAGTGYDGDDVDRIINEATQAAIGLTDPDELPEVDAITVKTGDLFELGDHRLLCGDSSDDAMVARVMGTDLATCTWTDPPYGVEYESKAGKVHNDGRDGLELLLRKAFAVCFRVSAEGAAIYVSHPSGDHTKTFVNEFSASGFRWKQHLPWIKDAFVLGHSDYHYQHEMIIYDLKPGQGRWGRGAQGWFGDNSQTSVLAFPKPKRSEAHPTMKPVELIEACLRNSSAPGHIVFDPFSGSGSTLMACERLQRKARAIELDPTYVQRTIARWEAFTGRKAVKS